MLNLKIAWRFITNDKWQSTFIALGIGVGVAVQMFVGLLIDSLQANLIDTTVGKTAHIRILPSEDGESITGSDKLINKIVSLEGVKIVQKVSQVNVLVSSDKETTGVLFKGVELGNDIFGISKSLIEGRTSNTSSEILIGKDLSEKLKVGVGNTVKITDNLGDDINFRISGIFDAGVSAINENWVVSSIKTAQKITGTRNSISEIVIQVDDVFESGLLSKNIQNLIKSNAIKVIDWQSENKELLSGLSAQSGSSTMIQVFVLLSVIIAITSVLSITVMQKQRQIGILKAMGLKDRDTMKIFLILSFVFGLVGSLIGLVFGFFLFFIFVNASGLFEPVIRWFYVIATVTITTFSATLAGFIPARRSEKLNPIEIIQNE